MLRTDYILTATISQDSTFTDHTQVSHSSQCWPTYTCIIPPRVTEHVLSGPGLLRDQVPCNGFSQMLQAGVGPGPRLENLLWQPPQLHPGITEEEAVSSKFRGGPQAGPGGRKSRRLGQAVWWDWRRAGSAGERNCLGLAGKGNWESGVRDREAGTVGAQWLGASEGNRGMGRRVHVEWVPVGGVGKEHWDWTRTFLSLPAVPCLIHYSPSNFPNKCRRGPTDNSHSSLHNSDSLPRVGTSWALNEAGVKWKN